MKKIIIFFVAVLLSGCKVSFNGASIPEGMKTVNVLFFENTAPLVIPYLSQEFTEELKTRIRTQTKLSITQGDADGVFEGRITNYEIRPVAIQDNSQPTAGANRLSITVNVKYTNNINSKQSYEESFTRFRDVSATGGSIETLQRGLINEINEDLAEDIFNRAFAQW